MINVSYTADKENKQFSLIVEGHAEFDEVGKDIVCSAASILTMTAEAVVRRAEKAGTLQDDTIIDVQSGKAIIYCECKNYTAYIYISCALDAIINGFALLAENCPDNVMIHEEHAV